MTDHTPDGWVIIRLETPQEVYYKVFGSWSGGYLDGDNWRINSGIKGFTEEENCYKFFGNSGSCYICTKFGEDRLNVFTSGVLKSIIDKANKPCNTFKAKVIYFNQFKEEFNNE